MTTQRDRILGLLRIGPVCAWDLYSYRMPRFAARIHELRQEGYHIETRPCSAAYHHPDVKAHIEYRLLQAGQQTFTIKGDDQ